MSEIRLQGIEKDNTIIRYSFSVSKSLECFFSNKDFIIEYSENLEAVPDAVAAIPFVSNVLPIIWLTDAKLIVPELDAAFYNCIPEVKKGYIDMYPETSFGGEIEIGKIVPNERAAIPGKCAMFYSGGVDSMETLYRHLPEKPLLVSIWGSDIRYDNEKGWRLLRQALKEAADHFNLEIVEIRSTFREFDHENALDKTFGEQLQRNYWYGIKHAMGLLGHVAVIAYFNRLSTFYIASSNCPADGAIRCASDPRTDNHIRFASCRVIHDGFELTRQDKLRNIVQFSNNAKSILPLHVCWETQTGKNCCKCEKCYRTMTGLILENADPVDYGFPDVEKELPLMQERMAFGGNHAPKTWNRLHADVKARQSQLKKNPFWKDIKWLVTADFLTPNALKMPLEWRIRARLSNNRSYRSLARIKRMIMKQKDILYPLRVFHGWLHGKLNADKKDQKSTIDKWPLEERIKGAMDLFEHGQGYRFDIYNPRLFPEKIVWYKLFYDRDDIVRLVDKYLFKSYIAEKLGSDEWTIPLIGAWTDINALERDWDSLPEIFCLKSTLQSDGFCIKFIHNRSQIPFSDLKMELCKWLEPENTLINSFCRAYYKATPRIIAEEFKTEVDNQLYDYKFFCFNGEPAYVYVATDHFPGQLSHISFYDLDWNQLDVQYGKHPNCYVEKPSTFNEMLRIASVLSEGFPFLRVDFFNTSERLYVAELTLYPGGGQTPIYPESFSLLLGDQFKLPTDKL